MAMCLGDGFTYVGHGGGPRPSLVVVLWEATVVLLFLPPLASSRCLRASTSVVGRATMSDDMTTGGEEGA
jgi:hypothetical protein